MNKKEKKLSTLSSLLLSAVALLFFSTGCANHFAKPTLPPTDSKMPETEITLSWVGFGEAYRYIENKWVRTKEQDYEFTVLQRRYKDRWESIKNLHRRHPNYDGSAGPRDNAWYFKFNWKTDSKNSVSLNLETTLGDGAGKTDKEFRNFELEFAARGISSMAPFNTYRIVQDYQYENGLLLETVDLFKKDEKGTIKPFARIVEKAQIYGKQTLNGPPTRIE